MINILYIAHSSSVYGTGKVLIDLLKYLDKTKFKPTVVLPDSGPGMEVFSSMKINTIILPINPYWMPTSGYYYNFLKAFKKRVDALVKVIEEENIELVHSQTPYLLDGAIAAKIMGIPQISHVHYLFDKFPEPPVLKYLRLSKASYGKMIDELSDAVVVVSNAAKLSLAPFVAENKISVIYNGIEIDKFTERKNNDLRNELGLSDEDLLICTIGRISKEKGLEDIVNAANIIVQKRNHIKFLIIGNEQDKHYANRIKTMVSSQNLNHSFLFLGFRKDIPKILGQIDIFVMSSKNEGLSFVCLEAMAARKVIVATRCGGPEEIIVDGQTGILVNVNNPKMMAEAILNLIENEKTRLEMGSKGRLRVEVEFRFSKFIRNIESLYLRVQSKYRYKERKCSPELAVNVLHEIGELGMKVMEHDRLIRGLKDFEALFKDNFLYRTLRACYGALSSKIKH